MFLYKIIKKQLYQAALIINSSQKLFELTWYIWGNWLYIDLWGHSPFLPFRRFDGKLSVESVTKCNVLHSTGNILIILKMTFECFWYYSQCSNQNNKIDDKIWNVFTGCLCAIFISLWVNNIHQLPFTCFSATSFSICNAQRYSWQW